MNMMLNIWLWYPTKLFSAMTLKELNSTTVAVLRLWFYRLLTRISDIFQVQCLARLWCSLPRPTPPLCVQMDFTQTFQTKTKCNKINHVCSYFYKSLVVLKYHRCLWANIFDTDINRCINTYIKVVYLASLGTFMLLKCLCQRYWLIGSK